MSDACCALHPPTPCGPATCPQCGVLGKSVTRITVGALLKPEYRSRIPTQEAFCFCRTAHCDVVYFRPGEALFRTKDLTVKVGLKAPDDVTAPACYCFGWTPEKIRTELAATGKSTVADQITAQVKAGNCHCETTNPQGSCCLGDVGAVVRSLMNPKP